MLSKRSAISLNAFGYVQTLLDDKRAIINTWLERCMALMRATHDLDHPTRDTLMRDTARLNAACTHPLRQWMACPHCRDTFEQMLTRLQANADPTP